MAIDTEPEVTSDKTNQIGSDRYYPFAVHAIGRKIAEHKKEIEKLVAGKEQLKKIYVHLRSILYLEGEALRKAVMLIFVKYWSLKLFFLNKTKKAGLKLPAASCRESSKCKVVFHFIVVRSLTP